MGYLKRPLGVIALFAAALAAGLFCLVRLPVSLLPSLSQPRLTVMTRYEHATPDEVDSLVTRRLEAVLGTVTGMRRMESLSKQGLSRIGLVFDWDRALTTASAEVREKLDSAIARLPREASPPLVLPYDPSQTPLITLALSGDAGGLALRRAAEERIKPRLLTLPGVAEVGVQGGQEPEVQVLVDKGSLIAHGMDLAKVVEGVKKANLNSPAGELRIKNRNMPVRTVGRFVNPQQIATTPLITQGQAALTVGQVATVRYTHKDLTGFCRVNGKDAVLISVLGAQEANALAVSDAVRQAVGGLGLAKGMKLTVVEDQAPLVAGSLEELARMVMLGGLLAILVLLVFLRRLRAAFLVALAAPLGLFISFGLMNLFGVGLNLMSIGGLALGVGMLLDGSIVVMEAFERHYRPGDSRLAAARLALGEVSGSLITGTLTTAMVLVPVFFMTGLAQRLFADFAFTLAASLLVSLATGLLLLPALLVWLGGKPRKLKAKREKSGGGFWFWVVRMKLVLALIALGLGYGAYWHLAQQGVSLLPSLGMDRMRISLKLPGGSGLDNLQKAVDWVEKSVRENDPKARVITRAGRLDSEDLLGGPQAGEEDQAGLTAYLPPGADPEASAGVLGRKLAQVQDAEVQVVPGGQVSGLREGEDGRAELAVLVGEDRGKLISSAQALKKALAAQPYLEALEVRGLSSKKRIDIKVERQSAALAGISVSQVARTVGRAVQGEVAGQLLAGDRQIDIRVRLQESDRQGLHDLSELPLSTSQGGSMQLNQAATLSSGQGPLEIMRRHRRPALVLKGRIKGLPHGVGQEKALEAARKVKLAPGVELKPGSGRRELLESMRGLGGALLLALALVYVILVVRFESLLRPLVVLLGLPSAAVGPALALHYLKMPLDALVLLGGVVLLGVSVNGSILLVDLADRRRKQGMNGAVALAGAARVRVKPLLMTTMTTVLGALPLCLELGQTAGLSRPLAVTVVSGLITGMLGTLFLVPGLFALFTGVRPQKKGAGSPDAKNPPQAGDKPERQNPAETMEPSPPESG